MLLVKPNEYTIVDVDLKLAPSFRTEVIRPPEQPSKRPWAAVLSLTLDNGQAHEILRLAAPPEADPGFLKGLDLVIDVLRGMGMHLQREVFKRLAGGKNAMDLTLLADDFLMTKLMPPDRPVIQEAMSFAAGRQRAAMVETVATQLGLDYDTAHEPVTPAGDEQKFDDASKAAGRFVAERSGGVS